ncbi:hypothetical protein BKA81DRAFT_217647 [Phyllosticta paracitricarpa]
MSIDDGVDEQGSMRFIGHRVRSQAEGMQAAELRRQIRRTKAPTLLQMSSIHSRHTKPHASERASDRVACQLTSLSLPSKAPPTPRATNCIDALGLAHQIGALSSLPILFPTSRTIHSRIRVLPGIRVSRFCIFPIVSSCACVCGRADSLPKSGKRRQRLSRQNWRGPRSLVYFENGCLLTGVSRQREVCSNRKDTKGVNLQAFHGDQCVSSLEQSNHCKDSSVTVARSLLREPETRPPRLAWIIATA